MSQKAYCNGSTRFFTVPCQYAKTLFWKDIQTESWETVEAHVAVLLSIPVTLFSRPCRNCALLLSSSCHLFSLPAGWTVHFELFLFASSKMVDKEWSYWLRSSGISNETLRWLTLVHLPGAGYIIHSWQHFHAGQHLFSESFVPTGFQTI